jgi:hypothetical protein
MYRTGFCFTFIPYAVHEPLRESTDETFFKLCKMRGVSFDIQTRIGSLFFLVDSIIGGAVSLLTVADTRKKSVDLAIHALSFVTQQFGKDTNSALRKCENLTTILINIKKYLKFDRNITQ